MNLDMESNHAKGTTRRALIVIGGGMALLGTWWILYMWVSAMTEGWLAPWDLLPVSQRPPLGTWQRTLNDFFEGQPGVTLLAKIVVAASALLFIMRVVRNRNRAFLSLEFATLNLLFIVLDLIVVIPAHWLPSLWLAQPRPPLDAGYHRTWPAIVVTACLLLVLFHAQATGWLTKRLRMSAKVQVLLVGTLLALIFASWAVPLIAF